MTPYQFGHGVEAGEYELILRYRGTRGVVEYTMDVGCPMNGGWVNKLSTMNCAGAMFDCLQAHFCPDPAMQSIARN